MARTLIAEENTGARKTHKLRMNTEMDNSVQSWLRYMGGSMLGNNIKVYKYIKNIFPFKIYNKKYMDS